MEAMEERLEKSGGEGHSEKACVWALSLLLCVWKKRRVISGRREVTLFV